MQNDVEYFVDTRDVKEVAKRDKSYKRFMKNIAQVCRDKPIKTLPN